MAEESRGFDPKPYLTQLQGKDYLEVKWRLVWLRTEHPDAAIGTDVIYRADGEVWIKASVSIPNAGSATGLARQTPADFRGHPGAFVEKCETKALGRALGALGYGTQFCDDFDEDGNIADSPVERPAQQRPASPSGRSALADEANKLGLQREDMPSVAMPAAQAIPPTLATDADMARFRAICKVSGLHGEPAVKLELKIDDGETVRQWFTRVGEAVAVGRAQTYRDSLTAAGRA